MAADRGPTTITVDGDPNGLYWDAASSTLFIADDDNNRILTYQDGVGVQPFATLPPGPPDGAGLGQLVRTSDGTIYVTRFGYGTAGAVVYAKADGTTGTIPNLDPLKRRIGLTLAPDGSLYEGYFIKTSSASVGAVAHVTLDGTETDVITNLMKPVGVLIVGSSLFVSDQGANEVYVSPLATPSSMMALAMLTAPDLLTPGPDGSLFTGNTTFVSQISASGVVSTLDSGFQAVRGTAYDAANSRIFISDHGGSTPGATNYLQIRPLN